MNTIAAAILKASQGGGMKGELQYKETDLAKNKYQIVPAKATPGKAESAAAKKKDTLVYLDQWTQKRIDETIDSPQKYLSRYHWDSKNIDQFLELCPHCRKPNLATYRRVVADTALNYLEEKEFEKGRHSARRTFAGLMASAVLISAGVYYLLFHFFSGIRL
jgi:hypothetical protein